MAKISKLIELIRAEGIGAVMRRVLTRVWDSRVMVLYECPFPEMTKFPMMPRSAMVVRCCSEDDLTLFEPHTTPEELELYRKRLQRGEELQALFTPDETGTFGWMWVTDQTLYEPFDAVTYVSQPGHVLHYDGRVIQELRGRALAFVMYPFHTKIWLDRGATHSVCAIAETNRPSIKIHERIGYTEVGRFTHFRFLKFEWARSKTPRALPGDKTANA